MRLTGLLIAGAIAGAAVLAGPTSSPAADIFFKGRFGDVSVGINTGGFRHGGFRKHGPFRKNLHRPVRPAPFLGQGVVNDVARQQWRIGQEQKAYRGKPFGFHRYRRRRGTDGIYYFDYGLYDNEPEPEVIVVPQAVPEPVPEVEVAAEPPDAGGPAFAPARGRYLGTAAWEVGQPLPRGRPHVALDWRDYDLPRPAPGLGYARFDGAVMLIETGSRVVREVIAPPQG